MTKLIILLAALVLGATVIAGIDYALRIELPQGWKRTLYDGALMLYGAAILGIMHILHLTA